MRARFAVLLAALALLAAPAFTSNAYADGIERPRPRVTRRAPPPRPAPPPAREAQGDAEEVQLQSNVVTLPESFFSGGGGVGGDLGAGGYYSHGSTVIIRGGSASAGAFAFASARASSGARGGFRGGGHGCACR